MDDTKMRWLIGAKIVCCGGLLLFLSGALSLAAVGSFVTGNALSLAGGGVLALALVAVRWQRRRVVH
jgi:hypothetical protein